MPPDLSEVSHPQQWSGVLPVAELAADVVVVQVPPGFDQQEALQQLARLVVSLLEHGMPEREISKRLMRYHPAQEGI